MGNLGRWRLIQVGTGLTPTGEAQTSFSVTAAESQISTHSGGALDAYFGRRAPLSGIQIQHSGVYAPCLHDDCEGCKKHVDEWQHVQRALGRYVPMMFVSNVIACDCDTGGCCPSPDNCPQYAWALGKISSITTQFSIASYEAKGYAEASFSAVLAHPLRPVTYERWRYGAEMPRSECSHAEPKRQWYIPCELPACCSYQRWWPRDLCGCLGTCGEFKPETWDAMHYLTIRGNGGEWIDINVGGGYKPRTFTMAIPGTRIEIEREGQAECELWDVPAMPRRPRWQTDTDRSGAILEWATTLAPAEISRSPFALEVGRNRLRIRGDATIGWMPQWVG